MNKLEFFSKTFLFILLLLIIYILEIVLFNFPTNIMVLIILISMLCGCLYLKYFFELRNNHNLNKESIFKSYAILYLIVLFLITSVFRGYNPSFLNKNNGQINLIPLVNTITELKTISSIKRSSFFTLILGNFFMFAPMTYFLKRGYKNSTFKETIISIMLMSITIEISQHLFGTGVFDIDDVFLNVFGAVILYRAFNSGTLSKIMDSIFYLKKDKLTSKEKFIGNIEIVLIILIIIYLIWSYWFGINVF